MSEAENEVLGAENNSSGADGSQEEVLDYYSELRAKREDRWEQAVEAAERTVGALSPGVYANYGSVILTISREAGVDRALAKRALDDLQGRGLARYQFGMGVSNMGTWTQDVEEDAVEDAAVKSAPDGTDGLVAEEDSSGDSSWSAQGVLYASRPPGDRLRAMSPSRDYMGHDGAIRTIPLIGDLPGFESIAESFRSDYLMDHRIGSTRLGSLVDTVLDLQDRAADLALPLELILDLTDGEKPLVIQGGLEELVTELSTLDGNGRVDFATKLGNGRIDYGTALSVNYALLAKTPPKLELDGNQLLAFLDEKSSTPFLDVVLEAEANVCRELAARIRSGAFRKR